MTSLTRTNGALALAAVLVPVLALAACSVRDGAQVACRIDSDCGGGAVCTRGACLPREPGRGEALALEIVPRTDSASAATEVTDLAVGPDALALTAEQKVPSVGKLSDVEGGETFSPAGHVVIVAPSRIPGRTPLEFETDLSAYQFQIGLPESLIGVRATVSIYPAAGTPGQPPVTLEVDLGAMMTMALPRRNQMTVVRGRLLSALGEPAAGYAARAYLDKSVVSNVATTDAMGAFQLLIPPGNVPPGSAPLAGPPAAPVVSVEFQPPGDGVAAPRLLTRALPIDGLAIQNEPPTFRMPAFGAAGPLRFVVMAGEVTSQRVAEATVRFRTEIPASPSGSAVYVREGRTDRNGEVEVQLIPGTAAEARLYDITVLPPPGSPYAAKCVAQYPVTAVGSLELPRYAGSSLMLGRKATLSGLVRGSDGTAAEAVSISATRVADRAAAGCTDAATTAPVSATSGRDGHYFLTVDPGTYRLDVDPAAGTPLPRLTEADASAVTVTGDLDHPITLPAGTVVSGVVTDAMGVRLTSAAIRFFQVLCAAGTCSNAPSSEPQLRAQTRTDAEGNFRAVLPQ